MPSKAEDIQKAELERQKQDLWKVYNPTNQDMEVVLNSRISPEVWTIKAKSEEIVPHYVAIMYADKMADKIVYMESDKAVLAENQKRLSQGFPSMNIHTEQARFESRLLKNMMGRKEKLRSILIVGLYKEFGVGGKSTPTDKEQQRSEFEVDGKIKNALGLVNAITPEKKPVEIDPEATEIIQPKRGRPPKKEEDEQSN